MLTKQRKENEVIIFLCYLILIFAIYNDALRIPGTVLTFYRMSFPIALLIVSIYGKERVYFIYTIIVLVVLTIIQKIVFFIFFSQIKFSLNLSIKAIVDYVSIILIFFLISIIKRCEGEKFWEKFPRFIMGCGFCMLVLMYCKYIDFYYLNNSIFNKIFIDNQNNYACYIAAAMPFFLVLIKNSIGKISIVILSIIILVLYDSKAVLFGCIIEFVIWISLNLKFKKKQQIGARYIIIAICFMMIFLAIFLNIPINEYYLRDIVLDPIRRIVTGKMYEEYTVSRTFRVNTTIFCFNAMIRTLFIGIGAGSTGVLLKHYFPNLGKEYIIARESSVLSLHNAWLEWMLDFGIIAILFLIYIYGKSLNALIKKVKIKEIDMGKIIFVLSFPIWIISASGVNTLYYIFVSMGYFFLFNRKERLNVKNSFFV